MKAYECIEEHQSVLSRFGCWPSFHDGEVHRIVLDRTRQTVAGAYISSIEIYLRGWIKTSEVTDAGFYKLEHDSVVHFRFEDVFDVVLDGFNHQNVLSSLNLSLRNESSQSAHFLHVELEHCFGLTGSFGARRAIVLGIAPFERRNDV